MRTQGTLAAGLALAALLTACAPREAYADADDSFKKGYRAIERKRWSEAIEHLRQAIAERPQAGGRVRLQGMFFAEYMPHYYLGLALLNAGDCQGALAAWKDAEQQGVVQSKSKEYELLVEGRKQCAATLPDVRKAQATPTPAPKAPSGPDPAAVRRATQTAEAAIGRADQVARAVGLLERDPSLSAGWQREATLGGAQKEGRDLLSSARSKLELGKGGPNLAQLAEAEDLAGKAAQRLEGVRAEATRRRQAAEGAKAAKPSAPSETLPSMAVREVLPAPLLTAARAFFAGQYAETSRLLDGTRFDGTRPKAHALLFRAAARYSLYVLGGQKDRRQVDAARDDVRACRRLDPALTPDTSAFSPRFAEFFKATR